ncbi:Imm49 family immunity protein [Streptomyces sp. NBC_01016]|uniref:Imm49 family immunity protein n=1 Tax=Streptomyces sp. NBC_01016 TaxID=2903720 RepID=UPI002B1DD0A8|nr:Imm49 family immunity protein [Streptomyces sp. NBC_01016]
MGERLDAALALDAAGATGPDQRLLRILLRGDQAAFEQALHERLVTHRSAAGEEAGPESLLPLGAIALSVLACRSTAGTCTATSAYLPASLLQAPAPAPSPS